MKLGQKLLLVTGSNGLIGSEMIKHFYNLGWIVHGLDNNMRADFIGSQGTRAGTIIASKAGV
jgi:CDP-paratose 2-epimerase